MLQIREKCQMGSKVLWPRGHWLIVHASHKHWTPKSGDTGPGVGGGGHIVFGHQKSRYSQAGMGTPVAM